MTRLPGLGQDLRVDLRLRAELDDGSRVEVDGRHHLQDAASRADVQHVRGSQTHRLRHPPVILEPGPPHHRLGLADDRAFAIRNLHSPPPVAVVEDLDRDACLQPTISRPLPRACPRASVPGCVNRVGGGIELWDPSFSFGEGTQVLADGVEHCRGALIGQQQPESRGYFHDEDVPELRVPQEGTDPERRGVGRDAHVQLVTAPPRIDVLFGEQIAEGLGDAASTTGGGIHVEVSWIERRDGEAAVAMQPRDVVPARVRVHDDVLQLRHEVTP
ncbi:MAG: hypothetical protein AB7K08_13070 [Microbacteriaceae bacterium]